MDQNNYQDRSVQQPAAEEKTTPRRRRADMYQQQGNAANVTNTETAKPAVEDVSGTTQKMPPIRSTFQRNAEAGETKQVKPVAPVAPVAPVSTGRTGSGKAQRAVWAESECEYPDARCAAPGCLAHEPAADASTAECHPPPG